jgi:hypothetical protein
LDVCNRVVQPDRVLIAERPAYNRQLAVIVAMS